MTPTIAVHDLRAEVIRSSRRRTMELSVERDGALIIRAPEYATIARMEAFFRQKRSWVYRKLALKEIYRPAGRAKEYVTGEDFEYLGRSYRLLLVESQDVPLRLEAGRFRLLRSDTGTGREHFIRWYIARGLAWLRPRVVSLSERLGVAPARIEVRDLGYHWGSCSKGGTVHIHWATILLPPSVVDYVVVHELVHLHERNHTPQFWRRIERAMPDYARRKAMLAERGAGLARL